MRVQRVGLAGGCYADGVLLDAANFEWVFTYGPLYLYRCTRRGRVVFVVIGNYNIVILLTNIVLMTEWCVDRCENAVLWTARYKLLTGNRDFSDAIRTGRRRPSEKRRRHWRGWYMSVVFFFFLIAYDVNETRDRSNNTRDRCTIEMITTNAVTIVTAVRSRWVYGSGGGGGWHRQW